MLRNIIRNYGKILIADRGNIAKQAIYSSKILGFDTVALYEDDDDLQFLKLADDVLKIDSLTPENVKDIISSEEVTGIESVFSTMFDHQELENIVSDGDLLCSMDNSFAKEESLNRSMIEITQMERDVQGLTVMWDDGQFVVIVCPSGLVACGAIDNEVLEKFGFAVTISQGTPEQPLAVPEDLLKAKVMRLTTKAEEFGITEGMSGEEALLLMKNSGSGD